VEKGAGKATPFFYEQMKLHLRVCSKTVHF